MKKVFISYSLIWAIMLVLFNIISFVSVEMYGQEKYTPSFWIGYIVITFAFVGQLACAYFALKDSNAKKVFYNISLLTTSYTGLVMTVVFGGLCMIISSLPYYVGIILCAIVFAFNAIAVVNSTVAIESVDTIDQRIKVQTFFIKSLTVEAETLLSSSKRDIARAECKKVFEAIRYSDPMSNDVLSTVESQITVKFSQFSEAVKADDAEKISMLANEVIILVGDRNKKCMILK